MPGFRGLPQPHVSRNLVVSQAAGFSGAPVLCSPEILNCLLSGRKGQGQGRRLLAGKPHFLVDPAKRAPVGQKCVLSTAQNTDRRARTHAATARGWRAWPVLGEHPPAPLGTSSDGGFVHNCARKMYNSELLHLLVFPASWEENTSIPCLGNALP